MSEYRDDTVLTETLERIRRAELATVIHLPGTPEHARAVERLDRATRQMRRLADGHPSHEEAVGPEMPAAGEPAPTV
jgi:hypothetical protein